MSTVPAEPLPEGAGRLAALGVSGAAEAAYERLLQGDAASIDPVNEAELVRADLVTRSARGLVAIPIHTALAAWQQRRAAEEGTVRAEAAYFADLYEKSASDLSRLTVLRGGEAVTRASAELHRAAKEFVHILERGPFYAGDDLDVFDEMPGGLQRGIVYQTLYHGELLRHPATTDIIKESIELGEQARVFDDVPLRIIIADDEQALVILPQPTPEGDPLIAKDVDGLLVQEPVFLEALARIFESYWARGTPVDFLAEQGHDGASVGIENIVSLLALGMTDTAIARALGISERTVHRRVSSLMESVNVGSRFQLGMQLSRNGKV